MPDFSSIIDVVLDRHPAVEAVYLFGSFGTEYERPDSDADIALLLPAEESKAAGSLSATELQFDLEHLLQRSVDLINLREVSTVFQKEVIAAERRLYVGDRYAADEFEMLTLSKYQKLNEERSAIVANALNGGRFHDI